MPKIVIQSDGDPTRVTLAERIVATHLRDGHYSAQLIERLTWAAEDAEALGAESGEPSSLGAGDEPASIGGADSEGAGAQPASSRRRRARDVRGTTRPG